LSDVELALARLEENTARKHKENESRQLVATQALTDLESKQALARVDLESFLVKAEQARQLFDHGLIAEGELLDARLQVKRCEIELQQLKAAIASLSRQHRAADEANQLELSLLAQEQRRQTALLAQATTTADRDGVLTWVVETVGTGVRKGD